MRFVWCDLEMTGLDPDRCAIIEVAVIVTDEDLNPLGELERVVWQPDEVLARMDPVVRKMHTANGLLERVRASPCSLMEAERDVVSLVSRLVPYREGVLAGNSIHTDRRFLIRYMPVFEGWLHYRQVDVSSLKVLAQAWYGDTVRFPKTSEAHTALADIRGSLAELAFYRQSLLRPPTR